MYRWLHKLVAVWQGRRSFWLQKYILVCACGVAIGMGIVAVEMVIFGSHGYGGPQPVGNTVSLP